MDLLPEAHVVAAATPAFSASQQKRAPLPPVTIPPPLTSTAPLSAPSTPLPRVAPPLFDPGQPAPITFESQPTSVLGQPPPIAPEIASGSSKFLIALIALGLAGGGWLIYSSRGEGSLLTRIMHPRDAIRIVTARKTNAPAPATQPPATGIQAPRQTATPQTPVTHPAPQQTASTPPVHSGVPPAQSRTAPPAPADAPVKPDTPVVDPAEERAATEYRVAENLLRRHQEAQGREVLAAIIRKYPNTPTAASAQSLLAQIPLPPPPKPVETPPPAPAPPPKPPTAAEDLAQAARAVTERGTARKPVIPPSLQSSGSRGTTPAVPAASLDDVRVAEARFEDSALHLRLEYNLGSSHTKPVFLGAWMKDPSVSQRLGYTSAQMRAGRGDARVVLPDLPANASQLHVIFFEVNGAVFFTKDFMLR